mmetsp:Transcript_2887/g.4968  ORF Transcript_2887/g.4968 Transcript_2887/m.4968 type:complete len:82 (-) Transcript_2887:453-698(-)
MPIKKQLSNQIKMGGSSSGYMFWVIIIFSLQTRKKKNSMLPLQVDVLTSSNAFYSSLSRQVELAGQTPTQSHQGIGEGEAA